MPIHKIEVFDVSRNGDVQRCKDFLERNSNNPWVDVRQVSYSDQKIVVWYDDRGGGNSAR